VVISIVGVDFTEVGFGKMELAYFKEIIAHFRPGARLDENIFEGRMASVGEDAQLAELYKRQPDNYLDARLDGVLPADRYEIVPVRWSRDPEESAAALPVVEKEIKKIFAAAKADGRPVYLVAHSWGTVLAHTVLHRLAVSNPEVRVEKFITLGSPLVPGHWWMEIFMDLEINAGQLQAHVAKPRNVGSWVNLWARNDYFSNEIKAADKNVRQDGLTVALEARVKKAAEQDHSLRPEALRDLFFLKSLKTWHFAYVFDFRIFLKTLKEYHEQRIFEPVISQELAY
jgi:pimeloyl-ACP methyl ester carboxylesterase